jgi:predicted transglutaminase-like cysteine proteinase
VLLQTMTDELAPRYERAFRMYAANSEASEADILATMRTDYGDGLTDEHTQTAKGTSKTTVRDTPDGQINDTSTYAGTVTDGVTDAGTTKSTRKGTVTVTQTGSDGVLGRVNENIRLWRDLETDLVKEYANAFMSFIWS